ncbi:unnamed protein product [Alopecurus aequalis]
MSNLDRGKHRATMPSPAPVPDWTSLAPDLVRSIGCIILATGNGDIDYYVSLRSVCHSWRAATPDPFDRDPWFRPYGWAMLGSLDRDAAGEQDGRRLFLNINTGRFMWKDMPMLHGDAADACLAADDTNGLLILKSPSDYGISVLNPFTGYSASYPKSWDSLGTRAVTVAVGVQPTRELYTFWKNCHVVRNSHDNEHRTYHWSPSFSAARVTFQDRCAYEVDEKGSVGVVEVENGILHVRPVYPSHSTHLYHSEHRRPHWEENGRLHVRPEFPSYRTHLYHSEHGGHWEQRDYGPMKTFLVDNDGEVLLVCHRTLTVQVFSISLRYKEVYATRSIGDRAILLGNRCLCVDASNLPGIEGNCIYYISRRYGKPGICLFRLEDKSHEKLFESSSDEKRIAPALPLSLPEVLMDYPKYVWRIGSVSPTWEY